MAKVRKFFGLIEQDVPDPEPAQQPVAVTETVADVPPVADVDQELLESLQATINEATTPALSAFIDVLSSLAEQGLSERVQYTTAFAAASKAGKFKVANLLEGIQAQKAALENERAEFQRQAAVVEKEVKQLKAGAEQLSQMIIDMEKQKEQALIEASEKEERLNQRDATFAATSQEITVALNQQETKITSYLNGDGAGKGKK
jgi:septal ring factor EnvC (AmiA/AmiB activator)